MIGFRWYPPPGSSAWSSPTSPPARPGSPAPPWSGCSRTAPGPPPAPRRNSALSDDIYRALARTALLIDLDIFGPGADHRRIIDGLRATTARIIAGRGNLSSPAGQTALVTLYAQLAMMG